MILSNEINPFFYMDVVACDDFSPFLVLLAGSKCNSKPSGIRIEMKYCCCTYYCLQQTKGKKFWIDSMVIYLTTPLPGVPLAAKTSPVEIGCPPFCFSVWGR